MSKKQRPRMKYDKIKAYPGAKRGPKIKPRRVQTYAEFWTFVRRMCILPRVVTDAKIAVERKSRYIQSRMHLTECRAVYALIQKTYRDDIQSLHSAMIRFASQLIHIPSRYVNQCRTNHFMLVSILNEILERTRDCTRNRRMSLTSPQSKKRTANICKRAIEKLTLTATSEDFEQHIARHSLG